ncbi:MAG: signal peptidase II [Synergistaceae bacterium]|nr:signal peptidase II [Synergistaceae bacterium]
MKYVYFAVVLAAALSIDRLTKFLALAYLPGKVDYAGGFHIFAVYRNYGMTFGILKDNPQACLILALLVIGLLVLALVRYKEALLTPGVAFLLAGALGNLSDRLIYGYVVDWIHIVVYINLADIWLCLGALHLFYRIDSVRRRGKGAQAHFERYRHFTKRN